MKIIQLFTRVYCGSLQNNHYKISIKSYGQPIPLSEQSKIFERFYRVSSSQNKKTTGTGLGLAISKEIIEQHDGEIGLETDGHYHEFWFTLPTQ